MKLRCRSSALAAASLSALGLSRRKITHTSTSIWAMPVRSSAPIALRYSVSIRAWAHMKLIRQIVLTMTWTEMKGSNATSLVMLAAATSAKRARDRYGLISYPSNSTQPRKTLAASHCPSAALATSKRCKTLSCTIGRRVSLYARTKSAASSSERIMTFGVPANCRGGSNLNSVIPMTYYRHATCYSLQPDPKVSVRMNLCSIRPPIGTKNPIPEKMEHRKITILVPVMNEVQLLFASEPCKLLKPRSL